MAGVNRLGNALPTNGSTSADTIRQTLAALFPNVIGAADDIEDIDYSEADKDAVPDVVLVLDTLVHYARDPDDSSSAHDGVTILVSADGKRFKSALVPQAFVNVTGVVDAPTGAEAAGTRYLVSAAPSGAFASLANKLVFKDGAGDWQDVTPAIGQRVYVRDEDSDYQYREDGAWHAAGAIEAEAVGAYELAQPWGMVVQSETDTPPGTRVTDATPTMPLGGTAADINDDTTATESTTSALGNLSAAAANARVIAMLDLGADTALAAIEVVGIKASTGSSSAGAMKLAYATAAAPTTWTDLGAGFTLSTTDQTVARSGEFTARYVAVITEAKDWSTATHTLDDLNAYTQATSVADGVKYIVAANAIGVFSGHDTEVAEAWNGAYRFYEPYDGAKVHNIALNLDQTFSGTEWESAAGKLVGFDSVFTAGTGSTSAVLSGSGYSYSNTTAPTTGQWRVLDGVTLTYTPKAAGNQLIFEYSATALVAGSTSDGNLVVALFRDSEVTALAWEATDWVDISVDTRVRIHARFVIEADDAQAHEYKIVLPVNFTGSDGTTASELGRRLLTITEFTG